MVANIWNKNRFNDLIERLRTENILDEGKLKKVIEYRELQQRIINFFVYVISIPSFLYLTFIFINVFLDINYLDGTKVQIFILCGFLFLSLYVFRENKDTCWKYVYLMTMGKRGKAVVTRFSHDYQQGRRWCEYSFLDDDGVSKLASFQLPILFDKAFKYKSGDHIEIAYDRINSNLSLIVSPKMEMFNLRKES